MSSTRIGRIWPVGALTLGLLAGGAAARSGDDPIPAPTPVAPRTSIAPVAPPAAARSAFAPASTAPPHSIGQPPDLAAPSAAPAASYAVPPPVEMPAKAAVPMPPTGPAPMGAGPTRRGGPIRRALRHVGWTLRDQLIGYPEEFVEPPLGAYIDESYRLMKSKADPHLFTLYQSDFLDGSTLLSSEGAARFNRMAARLPSWLGPVMIEWTPENPDLSLKRRDAVLAHFSRTRMPIGPERVVIGASNFPGEFGIDASSGINSLFMRDMMAPMMFPPPPRSTSTFAGSGTTGSN